MLAVDTNILARFYVAEADAGAAKQHKTAAGIMAQPALFVARTVVLELEWVLRGAYGYACADVARVLDHLLGLPNVAVENREIVEDALHHYHDGLDFADALQRQNLRICLPPSTASLRSVPNGWVCCRASPCQQRQFSKRNAE